MEINRIELKRLAKERMHLTQPRFWVVALAYMAMTTGVSWLVSFIHLSGTGVSQLPFLDIQFFLQILLMLYTTVVQFGLCLWALWTYRQLDPDINSLMQGFSVTGRVILMELGIYIRVVGWYFIVALLLSVPVFVLLLSNPGAGIGIIGLICYCIGLLAVIIILSLRYALAPYLLADRPNDGPTIPIIRSVALMRGWKMELFKLEFSFIGWHAVNFALSLSVIFFFLYQAGLFSAGAVLSLEWQSQVIEVIYSPIVVILSTLITVPVSLWLLPYRETARAGFYDARLLAASSNEENLSEMPPI